MQGTPVRIWPIARRLDPIRGELPERDDVYTITSCSRNEVVLVNAITGLQVPLGMDHITEVQTECDGIHRLILKRQVIDKVGQLFFEPILPSPRTRI
jgi:hypothetical protein